MNRRNFLTSCLALGGGSPLLTAVAWAEPNSGSLSASLMVTVGVEGGDGRRFVEGSPIGAISVSAHDPSDLLECARIACTSSRSVHFAGLGTAAHYFTLSTQLADLGYRSAYVGIHRYGRTELEHVLQGEEAVLGVLANRLKFSGPGWAEIIGHSLPELLTIPVAKRTSTQALSLQNPFFVLERQGHLYSWLLAPEKIA